MALDTLIVFAASYETQDEAIADYDAVHEFYTSAGLIDTYDAAVITRDDGKVKVVKKHEQPTRQGAWAGLGVGLVGGALVALSPRSRSPEVCWSEALRALGSVHSPDMWPVA